ncbi:ABC transporter permease [Hamadaea sp.]|uniref:ABC transporter permease n=1 Tax=Hamadaea sp. TaxID=2024425 RepID=UPI0025C1019A|nr:ABC transporter permease [Hamadaea sp.]
MDLFAEATAGVVQRPGRSALTVLGTVLGIGAFVAILGLTSTAGGQIDRRFTTLSATEVTVTDVGVPASPDDTASSFPANAAERVRALNGVVNAGVWWPVPVRQPRITAAPPAAADSLAQTSGLSFHAADPGALEAMHPVVTSGRLFDDFHASRGEHVAVLGAAAAARLGVTRLDAAPAVFVEGLSYTVIGVFDDIQRHPELLLSVIVPTSTALTDYGPPLDPRASMLIETRVGAADLIAKQAPLALRPDAPGRFKISAPADPRTLRGDIAGDLNVLFLLLAAISLVIGAVGIANTTLVAVLERSGEIGLRRSLGARRRHVAAQFLTESTALGTLGGLMGTSIGVAVVVSVALSHQWTAVLNPWTALPAPLVGSAVGLLAGLYPALRASWIEPVEALRR